jgi:hypothetical protein
VAPNVSAKKRYLLGLEMTVWRFEYFETGSTFPYSQTYFSAEQRDSAVNHYLRLGGDDQLKVTSARPLNIVLSVFRN